MTDLVAQGLKARDWLEGLLGLMAFPAKVEVSLVEDSCWLTIDPSNFSPEQIERLIGTRGESIDAIQYLANTILHIDRKTEEVSYTIELNGYRRQRLEELLNIANSAADEVRRTGQEVEVKSLSSAERRQIHAYLQQSDDLTTESRGQEPDRRLFIRLK